MRTIRRKVHSNVSISIDRTNFWSNLVICLWYINAIKLGSKPYFSLSHSILGYSMQVEKISKILAVYNTINFQIKLLTIIILKKWLIDWVPIKK